MFASIAICQSTPLLHAVITKFASALVAFCFKVIIIMFSILPVFSFTIVRVGAIKADSHFTTFVALFDHSAFASSTHESVARRAFLDEFASFFACSSAHVAGPLRAFVACPSPVREAIPTNDKLGCYVVWYCDNAQARSTRPAITIEAFLWPVRLIVFRPAGSARDNLEGMARRCLRTEL